MFEICQWLRYVLVYIRTTTQSIYFYNFLVEAM